MAAAGGASRRGLRPATLALRGALFVAVAAVTMELCARIDDWARYDAPLWQEYSSERLRGRDGAGGFTYNLPYARFEKWRHNSMGFRGEEVAREKKPGTTRVVCLGSSESYGLYESPGKEWPAQLQALLPGSRYEVVNASVVGLSLNSFRAYLQKRVFQLHPDIVVLVVNPLFYVTARNRAELKKNAAQKPAAPSLPPSPSLKQKVMVNLRILPKLKQVAKQVLSTNFPETFKQYQVQSTRKQVEAIERTLQTRALDKVPASYLDGFGEELEKTVELIRSHGAQVILTSYPALISRDNLALYPEIFLDNRRFCIELSLAGMAEAFSQFNSVTARVSREKGVPFVDTHLLLPKSTEFFGDNVHYTDNGARLFAQHLVKAMDSPTKGETNLAAQSREPR